MTPLSMLISWISNLPATGEIPLSRSGAVPVFLIAKKPIATLAPLGRATTDGRFERTFEL
jgi:hypothetical protein